MKEAVALPLDPEYLNEIACAYYCLSCAPTCGCCQAAPRCVALERSVFDYSPVSPDMKQMDRGIQMEPYSDANPAMAEAKVVDTYKDEY